MTPRQRGTDTAGRLLEAALAVHASHGTGGVTVPAVLAASGVSAGSLYHHFGSIEGLIAALYARCMGELLDALVADTVPADTAPVGVRALVRGYLEFVAAHPRTAAVVHSVAWTGFSPENRAVVQAVKGPRIAALLAWAHPHMAAGRMIALPDAVLEVLLIGPAAEAARRWLAGVPGVDLVEAIAVLPERVWRSVQVDGSSTP